MKSDLVVVSNNGSGIEAALAQAEKVALYKELSAKNALHLRLLTEEMMGMMRSITGKRTGQFWIEDEETVYQLHLLVNAWLDMDKRDQLLAASSTGKNEAAKGLMGRLRAFFEQGGADPALPLYYSEMPEDSTGMMLNREWSMSAYQNALRPLREKEADAREIWDELEKSVVTHVADDIKVFIRGNQVEMTIIKKMA